MDFKIRESCREDSSILLELIKELAVYEKLLHEVEADADQLSKSLFAENSPAFCVLAEGADGVMGFALYFFNYSTFLGKKGLYLEDLFVKPQFRGNGIGKALLKRLAQIAVDRDCGRMEWSVLKWNEPAIGFYKSLGAVPMDEWDTYRLTGEALVKASEYA